MKIFYCIDALNIGGSENQCVEATLRLQLKGHAVTVGCLRREGNYLRRLEQARVPVVEFSPGGTLLGPTALRQIYRLSRYLRENRFQVLHAYDVYSNLLGVPAARIAQVPLVISSQRDLGNWSWYTPLHSKVLGWIHGLSHVVVANSEAVRGYLMHKHGMNPDKIRVIRNAVDIEQFELAHRGRKHLGPDGTHKTIVMVANMHSLNKGHLELIEAAHRICRDARHAKFVLVGDGEQRAVLQSTVNNRGLGSRFVFLGSREDIPQILASANIAVFASHAEGLPNAVLEYAAAGLPVVATDVGGVPEIVAHGVNGLLVPPKEPNALADAILKILWDTETSTRMSQASRQLVREKFSYERLISELEDLYQNGRCALISGEVTSSVLARHRPN